VPLTRRCESVVVRPLPQDAFLLPPPSPPRAAATPHPPRTPPPHTPRAAPAPAASRPPQSPSPSLHPRVPRGLRERPLRRRSTRPTHCARSVPPPQESLDPRPAVAPPLRTPQPGGLCRVCARRRAAPPGTIFHFCGFFNSLSQLDLRPNQPRVVTLAARRRARRPLYRGAHRAPWPGSRWCAVSSLRKPRGGSTSGNVCSDPPLPRPGSL
jgi:hypothetical protein